MKKKQVFEFALHDTGDFVKVLLADGEKIILDYEHEQIKSVRVRAPLPNKEKMIETAKYWVEKDDRWQSIEQWINFYTQNREREIYDQIQEIRKCLKRIKQYSLSARIAKDALNEFQDNET